jgi:hypothetical protein
MTRPTSGRGSLPATMIAACTVLLALQAGTASLAQADAVHAKPWHHPAKWRHPAKWHGKTPFSCDPARFDGLPHYAMVRMNGGMITSIHLFRTEDGEEIVTSHPYGSARAVVTEDTRELCMRPDRLERFVDRIEERGTRFVRRSPGTRDPVAGAPAPDYNTGLLIGWNPSTGATTGECYNFTTETPADNVGSLNFSSENAVQHTTDQTNVSATVGGAFGAFSASASFAYTDKWQASANTGSAYFNISSVWRLNSTVDPNNPLTAQGQDAGDQFATLCGTGYMTSVLGGMVATVAVTYGSSSATASSDIDAKFKASFGLDSLKAAVDVSKDTTDSSSYFSVRLFHQGGGAKAGALLTSRFGATSSDGDAYVEECTNGDVDACELFTSNMAQGAIDAGAAFNALAQNPAPGANLNFFALFPNGIAGVDGDLQTAVARSTSDILAPYEDQLEQYLTLVNQIATLGNRATHLNGLVQDGYNPQMLDLNGFLGRLIDSTEGAVSYATSRAILLEDLGGCLNATSTNVEDVCSPIINGGETLASAYDFYDAEHGYPECTNGDHKEACWFLQQNTIALQYAAIFNAVDDFELPMDVLYVDVLPPFSDPVAAPIGGEAAFVAFADRPWVEVDPTKVEMRPNISILPLTNDTDLSNIYTSVTYRKNAPTLFYWYGILDTIWYEQSGVGATRWTTAQCQPSFQDPCPIGFEWDDPPTREAVLQQTANPLPDLFTAE